LKKKSMHEEKKSIERITFQAGVVKEKRAGGRTETGSTWSTNNKSEFRKMVSPAGVLRVRRNNEVNNGKAHLFQRLIRWPVQGPAQKERREDGEIP